ncbi:MAG TPA: hypothetical protein PLS39_13510, partial [Accumulibacter sp.]|nr:hypothetical protein [Accumulibacter sp.]HND81412.1 hypothetical protein [Accumulibacter sp.]
GVASCSVFGGFAFGVASCGVFGSFALGVASCGVLGSFALGVASCGIFGGFAFGVASCGIFGGFALGVASCGVFGGFSFGFRSGVNEFGFAGVGDCFSDMVRRFNVVIEFAFSTWRFMCIDDRDAVGDFLFGSPTLFAQPFRLDRRFAKQAFTGFKGGAFSCQAANVEQPDRPDGDDQQQ